MSEEIDNPEKRLVEVVLRDGRYPLEAFGFLHQALARAVKGIHGEEDAAALKRKARHVTGPQLCLALRDEAIERWGLLARDVLARWNIRGTIDFGNMVWLLVENKLMQKTPEDNLEDFRDVFRFEEAFSPDRVFGAGG